MDDKEITFLRLVRNPLKFPQFLISQLPSAFFAGLNVKQVDAHHCVVSVPYKWFTRNPFHSTYFACLTMAAEMSTGVLAMLHSYQRTPSVSLLVTKVDSEYFKKATGVTYFTCTDGNKLKSAIDRAISSGEPQTCVTRSEGLAENEEPVALFVITWSFKTRKGKE